MDQFARQNYIPEDMAAQEKNQALREQLKVNSDISAFQYTESKGDPHGQQRDNKVDLVPVSRNCYLNVCVGNCRNSQSESTQEK